jgi:hypothetical protein
MQQYYSLVRHIASDYTAKTLKNQRIIQACYEQTIALAEKLEPSIQTIQRLHSIAAIQRQILKMPVPFLHFNQKLIYIAHVQLRNSSKIRWDAGCLWLFIDRVMIAREKADDARYIYEVSTDNIYTMLQ